MIRKLRGFAKDSLFYGLGDGLGRLTSIILVPILSRIFVVAEYGIIDFLSVSYAFLLLAFRFNLLTGFQKFYYLRKDEERRVLVTSTLIGSCSFSLIICLPSVIFSQQISILTFQKEAFNVAIAVLAFCLPVETSLDFLLLLLRLNRRALTFSLYNIIRLAMNVLMTYCLVVWLKSGLTGVFIARLLTSTILAFSLIFQQRYEFKKNVSLLELKELLFFSLPGYPAVMIRSVMGFLPIYILTLFSSFAVVGIYAMAKRIAKVLQLFMMSFNRAWNPFAFSNAGEEDEKSLYEKVFKSYAACVICIGMSLSLFAKEIVSIVTPSDYHSAFLLVGGICLYHGIAGIRPIFSTALYSVNKVKLTSYIMILQLIVFLICSIKLVPLYGAKGLIVSLNISAAICTCCYLAVIYKYFRFVIQIGRLGFLLCVACVGVMLMNGFDAAIITTIVIKISFIITWIILCYRMLFNKNEKAIVKKNITLGMKRIS